MKTKIPRIGVNQLQESQKKFKELRFCESCLYFRAGEEAIGECCVLPPKAGESKLAVWPIVDFANWCGSFQPDLTLPEETKG